MSNPYELRLVVNRQSDGYNAVWIEPDGQQSNPFPLRLPLTPEDTAELRWYLEIYINLTDIARTRGDAEAAARWQAKYEAKIAELEQRRRGGGSAGL